MEAALARICFQQGRLDVGRVYLENARAVHDDAGLRLLAANYSRRAQAWQEVLDTLGNVEEWGESAEAHELRGEAQQRLGLVVQAVASYQFALSIDAERHLAHNNLAWALAVTLERPDEALSHALAAIQLLPTELEYHDTYLEVLGRLGREDEARRYLRDLLKQYPGDETLERRASALRLR
jgi:tetratricopeptide (TPR) repeat protein